MRPATVLIADDEPILTASLEKVLNTAGYSPTVCTNGRMFFSALEEKQPEIVLLDIYFGEFNGIQLLKQMREAGWEQPVIVMTAHADVGIAVEAMKIGALDFVTKPFDINHFLAVVEKAYERVQLQSKLKLLQQQIEDQRLRTGILGSSPALQSALETARRLAQGTATTVLLEGESGVGKELFARFIHAAGPRAEYPFISINCGAIPKELAESEFFGYEKGAFTGATERMKQGKFELANGGTILLDEIGELSLDMQVKLLRVLEEKRFYRLGGTKELAVDVRIVAATNRDLAKEVEAGRFREDLFYRLNVAVIKIPPLRKRKEDIPTLLYAFVKEFCSKLGKPEPEIAPETIAFLQELPWKGNVRELRNAVERVILLHEKRVLRPEQFHFLKPSMPKAASHAWGRDGGFALEIPEHGVPLNEVLRALILKTLMITNGNQVQAAKVLGITRSKLRYRMDQLGIQPQERSFRING
jgi:two-component system NtrC family response regulator